MDTRVRMPSPCPRDRPASATPIQASRSGHHGSLTATARHRDGDQTARSRSVPASPSGPELSPAPGRRAVHGCCTAPGGHSSRQSWSDRPCRARDSSRTRPGLHRIGGGCRAVSAEPRSVMFVPRVGLPAAGSRPHGGAQVPRATDRGPVGREALGSGHRLARARSAIRWRHPRPARRPMSRYEADVARRTVRPRSLTDLASSMRRARRGWSVKRDAPVRGTAHAGRADVGATSGS